ncbi:MAG: hypothetical protein WCY28_03350 [Candidatus Shapirobacteria bacterium]|jgi:hypothetical protein
MNKNIDSKNLVILLLIGIVLLSVGAGIGVIYQIQKDGPLVLATKSLSSEIIASIAAYGEVTNIDGRNITLSFMNENLTIFVSEEARVYSFKQQGAEANSKQNLVDFSDIKKGDFINISVKLSSDGKLEGNNIVILPPISTPVE